MFDNEELTDIEVEEENENEDEEFVVRNGQQSSQPPQVDLQFQSDLRKLILGIQNDMSFKPEEKAHKIQNLMTSKWRQFEKKPSNSLSNNNNNEPTDEDLQPTYNEKFQVLGCKHYRRGAKLQANCCNRWFTCRFCHDDACDHQIDRHATKNMMCMHCQTVQPVSKSCDKCERELARYYCDVCKFWDDQPDKKIYHCDSCGICRVGRRVDYFHCDVCDCCIQTNCKDSHKCIEKNLERDCVICGEYLFTSTSQAIFMPCGHIMHNKCYNEYTKTAYQCPTCWKSIGNMDPYFRRIDLIVAQQKMPPEYENFVAHILCNDCEKRSTVKYHFLYHKCPQCRGYNTKVLETRELPSEEESSPEEENDISSNNNGNGNSFNSTAVSSFSNNATSNNNNNNVGVGVGGNGGGATSTNGSGASSSGAQVRQSRVMEVTAMMQGEDGPVDGGNATEHRTRNPLNSLESNHMID